MDFMKRFFGLTAALVLAAPALAADPAPVKLIIKPLLCVIDKAATSCAVTFDIRWKSVLPGEYCVGDSVQATPLRCWTSALAGDMTHERVFSEDFSFWLAPPAGSERLSEVKIEVLRVGSDDRRRQRRSRHVWDVL
jgi:Protein of unknown function (DUF3019)